MAALSGVFLCHSDLQNFLSMSFGHLRWRDVGVRGRRLLLLLLQGLRDGTVLDYFRVRRLLSLNRSTGALPTRQEKKSPLVTFH